MLKKYRIVFMGERLNLNHQQGEENEKSSEKQLIGKTRDGSNIYEYGESHFHEESGLDYDILEKAIGVIDSKGRETIKEQVNFDRPLGLNMCVDVGEDDKIVMVYRKGRLGKTPMVRGRTPKECNSVIVIAKKKNEMSNSDYQLLTAYVGELAEKEPWDPTIEDESERKRCEEFWNSHALIYNADLIDWSRTEIL